ncbi:MAG: glycosyltransferase [Geobacteraceae bacterium]|nr:glycosyltransferase [Geobacteraceae bacterium]
MVTIIRKIRDRLGRRRTLENVCHSMHTRRCLLCYVVAPFLHDGEPNPAHQNQWQAREIARQLDRLGFCVDVINYDNRTPRLRHQYDLVIDIHPGNDRPYLPFLKPGGKKIAYITGSNPVVANQAELKRLDDLFERRGVRLAPLRQADPFPAEALERFNAFFLIGNSRTLATYDEFNLPPVFLLPNTAVAGINPAGSGRSTQNFLFLASGGQVHKGLDLLLELFPRHPQLQLHVCSSFRSEHDFCKLYHRELFATPNIHPEGFLDITGHRFQELAGRCAWMLLPSCAEGMSGSVTAAMSAGMVSVVSTACGFEDDEVILLPDCSLEAIERTVLAVSSMPADQVADQREKALKLAEERYATACFSKRISQAFAEVLRDSL